MSAPADEPLSEDNVARRIAAELQRRGWSQERLAKEMTAAGCRIHQTAISKIVNPGAGVPRRAISIDEAVNFAKVFATTVMDLMSDESHESADQYKAGWRDGYGFAAAAVRHALDHAKPGSAR